MNIEVKHESNYFATKTITVKIDGKPVGEVQAGQVKIFETSDDFHAITFARNAITEATFTITPQKFCDPQFLSVGESTHVDVYCESPCVKKDMEAAWRKPKDQTIGQVLLGVILIVIGVYLMGRAVGVIPKITPVFYLYPFNP